MKSKEVKQERTSADTVGYRMRNQVKPITDSKNRSSGNTEGADAEQSSVGQMIEVSNDGQEL